MFAVSLQCMWDQIQKEEEGASEFRRRRNREVQEE